jgi:hypothetical protein
MSARAVLLVSLAAGCVEQHNLGDTPQPIGHQRWAVTLGGAQIDNTTAIAIDGSGDLVAMGRYTGTIDVGEGPVMAAVDTASWLTKRDGATGAAVWAHAFEHELAAMALDTDGTVVVAGGCGLDVSFCGQVIDPPSDLFVAKYGLNGDLVWARGFGSSVKGSIRSLAVTPDGTIVVDGTFHGTIDVPGVLLGGTNAGRPFLAAFSRTGAQRFVRAFEDDAGQLVAAPDGRVLMTNAIDHALSLDGIQIRPSSASSPYIAQLTDDGHVAWAHAFGPLDVMLRPGAVTVAGDDIVLAMATGDIHGFPLKTGVTSLDRDGMVQWSTDSTAGRGLGTSIAVASGGAIVTGGTVESPTDFSVDFGSGPQIGTAFLAAYTPEGQFLQSHMFGDRATSTFVTVSSVATASSGALAFGGRDQDDALLVMFDAP